MNIKKILYFLAGLILLGIAYIGWIVPGIPFSIPAVFAAICFAKSNDNWYNWMITHPKFGSVVNNWSEKKVFPTKMKYVMLLMMTMSITTIAVSTGNIKAVMYSAGFMIFGAVWGWRYPGSVEEYDRRKTTGKRIGWFK